MTTIRCKRGLRLAARGFGCWCAAASEKWHGRRCGGGGWLGVFCLLWLVGCTRTEGLQLGGYIEAERIEVGSRVGGRVQQVFVEEGAAVKLGQVLVKFETVHLEAQLSGARHRAARLATFLEKLQAGPRRQEVDVAREALVAAEARLKNAKAQYQRGLEAGESVTTREKLDNLETAVLVAESEQRMRHEELNLLEEGTRAEDLVIARRELEEAQAEVLRLEDQLAEGEVRAPIDAVVEVFDIQPGDLIAGGAPLATLVRRDQIWVRCFVPTTQLVHVRPGMQVQVDVDARPGRPFTGEVLRINRAAEYTPRNVQTFEQREDQVFGMKVRVHDPEDLLRPGMAAVVRVPRSGTTAAPAGGNRAKETEVASGTETTAGDGKGSPPVGASGESDASAGGVAPAEPEQK